MRFMLDESAHLGLVGHLGTLGHDVTVVGREYPPSLDDPAVLAIAQQEGRVLITNDRDFGELVFDRFRPHSGVILLRLKGLPLATQVARLDHVLADHADDLRRFLVVTETNVRVR